MNECPENLNYSNYHMWAETDQEKGTATIGLTEDLAEMLDEFYSIDLPMINDEIEMDKMCIHIHMANGGIKHLRCPLSGRIIDVNKEILDNPDKIHLGPYKHWVFKMEYDEPEEVDMLMSASQYTRFLDSL